MKNIKWSTDLVFLIIAIIAFLISIIWYAIVYINNWDLILSQKQMWILYWKPSLLLLVTVLFLNIRARK